MSKQSTGVIARTNGFINDHKVASSLVAGSLLASTAFVSAAAINLSGQYAKESYSYPTISQTVVSQNTNNDQAVVDATPVIAGSQASDTPTYVAPAPASTPAVKLASTPAVSTPAVAAPTVVTPATPVTPVVPAEEETPVDETPANPQPAFGIQINLIEELGMRSVPLFGDGEGLYRIDVGHIDVNFDEDYTNENLTISAEVTAQPENSDLAFCEIDPDKPLVYFVTTQDNTPGTYVCKVTLTDGTITKSAAFCIVIPETTIPTEVL